ncbi:MAG: POTRA domain-containing protein [Imperialibacter sp.]|uniref:POTRA domain-containing protein n=1 Tax=Imperialibacter sp. TaxID=2038411 RepID=UPI0032EEE3B2
MIRCFAAIILNISICFISDAQEVIESIEIKGIKRTEEQYLRQFIYSRQGETYDSLKVENDRQRLANLPTIGEVSVTYILETGAYRLTFTCSELLSVEPIFGLGKSYKNFWCRVGVQDSNISGKGHELIAYYQYYDRHSAVLKYRLNRIHGTPWSFTSSLTKWSTIEPITIDGSDGTYDYDNLNLGISSIRHFSFQQSLEVGVSGLDEKYMERDDNGNKKALMFRRAGLQAKAAFTSNYLNYNLFYIKGWFNQLNVQTIDRFASTERFDLFFNDLKFFSKPYKSANIAVRLRIGLSTNVNRPFAPFVLDNFVNIRGVGNRVDRGTGSVVLNAEFRQTIFDGNKIAGQGVVFTDLGTWRLPGGNFKDFTMSKNMKSFSGAGLRLIYKHGFDTVLRIDYGHDFRESGDFVFGIGQYF